MSDTPNEMGDELGLDPVEAQDITDADITDADIVEDLTIEEPPRGLAETELVVEESMTAVTAPPAQVYKGSGFRWSLLLGAVLTVAIIILILQNFEPVTFEFLTWTIDAPLAALLLGAVLLAVLIDELVGYFWRAQRRRTKRKLAELKALKAQMEPPKERRFQRKAK